MRIFVKAKPKSKFEKVEKVSETNYIVSVREPPEKGKANDAICRLLAGHFGVRQSMVRIKAGQSSRNKIVEIFRKLD
jgi:hypothetical protein